MRNREELPKLIADATLWRTAPKGFHVEAVSRLPTGENKTWSRTVTADDLASLDINLSLVISALFQRASELKRNYVRGELIRATRALWADEMIALRDFSGSTVLVSRVLDISERDDQGRVVLFGEVCTPATLSTADGTATIEYISQRSQTWVALRDVDIEARFPNWETRLHVGQGLDMPQEALVTYVFPLTSTAPATPLPDVALS